MMDYGVRARCVSLQYRCGKGWIIATATGPPRASEIAYGVEGVVAKLDAEVRGGSMVVATVIIVGVMVVFPRVVVVALLYDFVDGSVVMVMVTQTTLATAGESGMVVFSRAGMVLGFVDSDVRLIVIGEEWRAPGAEAIPHPHDGEHVFFKAWLDLGFMSPRSRFLWDLLFFFKLHPQDISPNLLLHVSMYTMACEWYLGIEPSLLMS
ncbi:hypothetical protein QYE76_010848 [Lolium multiflorum]|uniref:Transposase (putative) gypsy type domain-containing protein n=1 Tax=Lolium multiflorum TaxID=4521 RepID=A0AAD8TVU6_LOLMU|nr:hypothetical protein QYE76_010848 [Lolium multiflorum]